MEKKGIIMNYNLEGGFNKEKSNVVIQTMPNNLIIISIMNYFKII